MSHKHNHKHKKEHRKECGCDKPPYFHDRVGKGTLDSTPIEVPSDFNAEAGSSLNLPVTNGNPHPGPFAAAAFHPSEQKYFGLQPRRNTPNKSPEKAGKVLIDYKHHDDSPFYKPRVKNIHRNFAKKTKEHH